MPTKDGFLIRKWPRNTPQSQMPKHICLPLLAKTFFFDLCLHCVSVFRGYTHGLRTPNEGINQRNLKFWADVADKICFGHTYKFGIGIWFSAGQWKRFPHRASVVRGYTDIPTYNVPIHTIWILQEVSMSVCTYLYINIKYTRVYSINNAKYSKYEWHHFLS